MIVISFEDSELKFLKNKFINLYNDLLPYLDGNDAKFPNEEIVRQIDGKINDAIVGEYDNKKDHMSSDGIRLEDIWSLF
jgi:hypothetical protein